MTQSGSRAGRHGTRNAKSAYRELKNAQKTNYGAPAYSRWVNRPAGRVLASAAFRAGMSPNQVTAASVACTYSACAMIAAMRPSLDVALVVSGLLLLGYALDSADGQLARLTGLGRPSGEWLDHVADMGKICLLNAAIAVSWLRWGTPGFDIGIWAAVLPLMTLTVGVVSFFGWLLGDLLKRCILTPAAPAVPRGAPVWRSLLRLPGDYGLFALSFVLFPFSAFLLVYVGLLLANSLILAVALPTWYRQLRAAEALT